MTTNKTLAEIEFSDVELQTIDNALKMLEETFAGKTVDLKPDEVSLSAQASNDIEHWSNVACTEADCTESLPLFASVLQWAKDEKVREQLNPRATRLKNIAKQVIYTNRLVLHRCWASSNLH